MGILFVGMSGINVRAGNSVKAHVIFRFMVRARLQKKTLIVAFFLRF